MNMFRPANNDREEMLCWRLCIYLLAPNMSIDALDQTIVLCGFDLRNSLPKGV